MFLYEAFTVSAMMGKSYLHYRNCAFNIHTPLGINLSLSN